MRQEPQDESSLPYHASSSEADPLIEPRKPSRPQSIYVYAAPIARWIYVAPITRWIFAFMIIIFFVRLSNNSLDLDRIRKDWDIEFHQHQEEVLRRNETRERWRLENDDRIHLREQWRMEAEEHERDIEERRKSEEQERNLVREMWGREVAEHGREVEERRKREEQERNVLRDKWGREVEEHEHEVEKRRKHEEEERLRLNMFWTDLESHTCTTYATREYTARLVNVPSYYNRRVEACMATSVKIHGAEYMPKWCEDHGPDNVIGHWEVDQHEPDCASYWFWYKDLGCISPGSGQRRFEHYLENLPSGADWKEFCATTPASFNGMHFIGAEFCFQKDYGTYGHWVFDDESCK
ncbi:hypothetical protein BDR04DRAFT_1101444 [Suillus decipiens]|nr:hypothetical protein BDR04DRAFT_1101444 [Suillus decipiens]